MYYVSKRIEISACHKLNVPYESKCTVMHGHNWIVTIFCKAKELNADGMVCDFALIKKKVQDALDHKVLNEVLPFNPTAENMARWITEQIPNCYKTSVQETEGNVAVYERDE